MRIFPLTSLLFLFSILTISLFALDNNMEHFISYPSLLVVRGPALDPGLLRAEPNNTSSGKIVSGSTMNELSSPSKMEISSSIKQSNTSKIKEWFHRLELDPK